MMTSVRRTTRRTADVRVLIGALVVLGLWVTPGLSVAEQPLAESPECPADLGLDEPIGPCGRDGNGPGPIYVDDPDEAIDHEDPPPFVVECPYEVPDHAGAAICADPPAVDRSAPAADPTPVLVVPLAG